MIEKIGSKEFHFISAPSEHVIYCLKKLKFDHPHTPLHVCEVGIGIGATSIAIVENLSKSDYYYIFDFENKVNSLYSDLINKSYGNTNKTWDSYAWTLVKFFLKNDAKFDLVYLDGAHTFFHDASSCCILKELLKTGGYLILDDIYWTYEKSPTANPNNYPKIRDFMTDEQISTPHIHLISKAFLDTDSRFKKMNSQFKLKENRFIYMKS